MMVPDYKLGRVYSTVNGRRFSNTNSPLMVADSQILMHR